jgi:hypothetical protein
MLVGIPIGTEIILLRRILKHLPQTFVTTKNQLVKPHSLEGSDILVPSNELQSQHLAHASSVGAVS